MGYIKVNGTLYTIEEWEERIKPMWIKQMSKEYEEMGKRKKKKKLRCRTAEELQKEM